MEHEPHEPDPDSAERAGAAGASPEDAAHDALRRLEERLDRASDAAERLIAEAAAHASSQPPPSGWQVRADEQGTDAGRDVEVLAHVLRALRDLIPPELQRKLAEALRELLLAVRALIDWYLERVEHRRRAPAEVQDIPIL
jgi:hypothetical protein